MHYGNRLDQAGSAEAEGVASEAVQVYRRLARLNPVAFEPLLARALQSQGPCLAKAGRLPDALAAFEESVAVLRRLVRAVPASYEPRLIEASMVLGAYLFHDGQRERAVALQREQLSAYRRLVRGAPDVHGHKFIVLLLSFAAQSTERPDGADDAVNGIEEALALLERDPATVPARILGMHQEAARVVADHLDAQDRGQEADVLRAKCAALPGSSRRTATT